MKGCLLCFLMTPVVAVLGEYSKIYNCLKLLMYFGSKYSRLSTSMFTLYAFLSLSFVYITFADVF